MKLEPTDSQQAIWLIMKRLMSEKVDPQQHSQEGGLLKEPEDGGGTMLVRPDKNVFLLFSMLNATNRVSGEVGGNSLRQMVADHFSDYRDTDLNPAKYVHESKAVTYVLTLNEAPDFTPNAVELSARARMNAESGAPILQHLINFYNGTDFEGFYQKLLPEYQAVVEQLKNLLGGSNIELLLSQVWGNSKGIRDVIIPNPLAQGSFGPQIGDVAFQIVGGGVFGRLTLHSIAHEASHPRAKAVLEPIRREIAEGSFLLEKAMSDPRYPREYGVWETCFEEHFIRAVQAVFIDPKLIGRITPRALDVERNNGMVFIDTFVEELNKFKPGTPKLDLRKSALNILQGLIK